MHANNVHADNVHADNVHGKRAGISEGGMQGGSTRGGIWQKSGVFPVEAGPEGKKEHGRPGGLWDFTAGGGEVRAEEAAWRSKEEEKRQRVNLSALKNISRRA